MNANDVLKYGHKTVLDNIAPLTDATWNVPGACGVWSSKDIIAHLASYELLLVDVLAKMTGVETTPQLDQLFAVGPMQFNDVQVGQHKHMTAKEVVDEYSAAHTRNMHLITRIPDETVRQPGTLPWYGMEYALDDYIVYSFYGHKREHCAQIAAFLDRK